MRLSLFENYGAKNSVPVFDAFRKGAVRLGFTVTSHDVDADVAVIWSRLWAGRMKSNQVIWKRFHDQGKPIMVIEVGSLRRNLTWKISLHQKGRPDSYGHGIDISRPARLGLDLVPWRTVGDRIIIACQRTDSHQWQDQPRIDDWLTHVIDQLRSHTNRKIVIRSHPRQSLPTRYQCSQPKPIPGSYDDFDFLQSIQGAHAVINVNSGPGILSVMQGIPVFVQASSLAAPVGNLDLTDIESPLMPDRSKWFLDICHTEWTLPEIESGWPISRLFEQPFG
jgi:hypothetical protein